MLEAYGRLHSLGHAHSVEVWDGKELVGGLYGVKLGRVFFGESMFHQRPYASKVALVFLVEQLRAQGVELLDCQQPTPHMLHFGAEEIPRQLFLQLVRRLCAE
jgi:leucyl/phenylalanyl-tRNA--protein transferase